MKGVVLSPEQIARMTRTQLSSLAKHGIVTVTMDMPERTYTSDLDGRAISISAAARKYNINHATIVRWVQKGLIKKLGMDKNRVLIDEGEMAKVADSYKQNPGQGKWSAKSGN